MTRLKIGLSACFMYADPERKVFAPKTLQYAEQSMARWLLSEGVMPLMIPSPSNTSPITIADYAAELDGLVLQGGSDVCPLTYGEQPLRPEWNGDRDRDIYEMALIKEFQALGKPVLGIGRGAQIINVAFGGTLYQDIGTQRPDALTHRHSKLYDMIFHRISLVPGSGLALLYRGVSEATVNTVHHQAAKDIGRDLVVEAWSQPDQLIEALRWRGTSYIFGVQWHPEFQDLARTDLLDTKPLLHDFLAHVRAHRHPLHSMRPTLPHGL